MARDSGTSDSPDTNRPFVKRFIEDFWAGGDLSRVEEFLAPSYVVYNLLPG